MSSRIRNRVLLKNLQIRPLAVTDVTALVEFETENRTFFEKSVPPRAPENFNEQQLAPLIGELLVGENADQNKFYLILTGAGKIVGRINMTSINREKLGTAALGYRVAQAYCQRGIATAAVAFICDEAKKRHGLGQLTAQALRENIGSTNALLRNGFQRIPDDIQAV